MKRIRKFVAVTSILLISLLAVAPLALYSYTLGLLSEMPKYSTQELSEKEASEMWVSNEHCTPSQCSSITPYWIYRWLFGAVTNDLVTPVETGAIYSNVSKMASQVAIYHMRQGHVKDKGMGWWHLTHINLSIWLQRNWEAKYIAAKFIEINA